MYKVLLCLRYLRTRYIALASIISVTLGVATMIVVNSVMAGFSTEMRERIHGILADVVIETNGLDGQPDAERHLQIVRDAAGEYVAGMTATVEVYGMLSFQYAGQYITRPVTLIGIVPEEKATVGPLRDYLASYNPVREDGKEVRPALRDADEKLSFRLTEKAATYRREWLERQQWMQKQFLSPHGGSSTRVRNPFDETTAEAAGTNTSASGVQQVGGVSSPTVSGAPPAPPAPLVEAAGTAPEPPEFEEPAGFGDQAGEERFEREEPDFAEGEVPEFEVPDFNVGGPPAEPEDPSQPLDARAYVGEGLVSFPYEDQTTGKSRTMMMVRPGDDVKLSTVTAGRPPNAVHFNATVVDVFRSGMSEYDSNLVFCNLEYLQQVRGMVDPSTGVRSITSIQLKLNDFGDADEVVRRLRAAFPPGTYTVRTWEQKQGPLLAAVEVESAILNVLLFLIIAVAGFGILAIFYMIVVEKTRDIGILMALGASSRGVMSIFLSYGLALGIVGSGVGMVLGLLFVDNINLIEKWITWLTGRKVFDEKIYYFPEIPTAVNPAMVIWVAAGAMAIAVLASILPARRASRLHPVEALRYE